MRPRIVFNTTTSAPSISPYHITVSCGVPDLLMVAITANRGSSRNARTLSLISTSATAIDPGSRPRNCAVLCATPVRDEANGELRFDQQVADDLECINLTTRLHDPRERAPLVLSQILIRANAGDNQRVEILCQAWVALRLESLPNF